MVGARGFEPGQRRRLEGLSEPCFAPGPASGATVRQRRVPAGSGVAVDVVDQHRSLDTIYRITI